MNRAGALVGPVLSFLALLAFGAPADAGHDETVVSLTFDGTHKSQTQFAAALSGHGLTGTFYVNAGYLDYPGYLSVEELREIGREHEIAGASLFGNDLTQLSSAEAEQQICDDRATLADLGFAVTSFAYPHGARDAAVSVAVRDCGYRSARDYGGLHHVESCTRCPPAETDPGRRALAVRTAYQSTRVADLQRQVLYAEATPGGWLPLVFTRICECPREPDAVSPEDFTTFLAWLDKRPHTVVHTVDDVLGGSPRPVSGTVLARFSPEARNALPLSRIPAWTVLGVGIGQTQLIFFAVTVGTLGVIAYRTGTRGNRYGC